MKHHHDQRILGISSGRFPIRFLLVTLLQSAALASGLNAEESGYRIAWKVKSKIQGVMWYRCTDKQIEEVVNLWPSVPLYAKTDLLMDIHGGITTNEWGDDHDKARPVPLQRRLDNSTGRSVVLFERLARISVPAKPAVDGQPGPASIDFVALDAFVGGYVRGLCDAGAMMPGRLSKDQLKAKYHGKIREPKDDAPGDVRNVTLLGEFMDDFQPLGKPLATLRELTGLRGKAVGKKGAPPVAVDFSYTGANSTGRVTVIINDGVIIGVAFDGN